MSVRSEKLRAIKMAREYLLSLCRPGKMPTKKEIRESVRRVLKHYPSMFDIVIKPDGISKNHKYFELALKDQELELKDDNFNDSIE